jgi:hypothetical protein
MNSDKIIVAGNSGMEDPALALLSVDVGLLVDDEVGFCVGVGVEEDAEVGVEVGVGVGVGVGVATGVGEGVGVGDGADSEDA